MVGETRCAQVMHSIGILPQLNIDLPALLLLGVGENRVMVLLQARHHTVVAVEFDETGAHELFSALVCTETDIGRLDLFEMLLDLLFRSAVGKVA